MINDLNTIISAIKNKDFEIITKLLETDYSDVWHYYKGYTGVDEADICLIFRSHKDNGMWFTETPKFRKSFGCNNIHTVLMSDILPSWQKYPKRNHSFICSTNIESKDTYLDPDSGGNYNHEKRRFYIALPKNGTKLGVCPEDDLWNSFHFMSGLTAVYSIDIFDDLLKELLVYLSQELKIYSINADIIINMFNNNDTKSIIKMFNVIDTKFKQNPNIVLNKNREYNVAFFEYFISALKKGRTFVKILDYMLNPKRNDFTLKNTKTLNCLYDNSELWFDSECLFIDYKFFTKYVLGEI